MFRTVAILVAFLRHAETFLDPDELAWLEVGDRWEWHFAQHKRIVKIAVVVGIITTILALVGVAVAATGLIAETTKDANKPNSIQRLLVFGYLALMPFLGFIIGCIIGAALACMIAPGDFLRGPFGRKWLSFVGVRFVPVARLVCFVVVLLSATCIGVLTLTMIYAIFGLGPRDAFGRMRRSGPPQPSPISRTEPTEHPFG